MKLFISWSGSVSQQIATELRNWLPLVLPAVNPFITTSDIDKGALWAGEISKELAESNYGIVCLTADNLASKWLAFEAGALSKHLEGRVATILFGVEHSDVSLPLSMFQGTIFTEEEVRKLVNNIDANTERPRREQLEKVFPMFWPALEAPVKLILEGASAPKAPPSTPNFETIAQEMLALLRQQNAVLSAPEKFLEPVLRVLRESGSENELTTLAAFRNYVVNTGRIRGNTRGVPTAAEAIMSEEQPKPDD
jgi:hypothetical protein